MNEITDKKDVINFFSVVENGDIEGVKWHIENGTSLDVLLRGKSLLTVAASHGDVASMELLLSTAKKETVIKSPCETKINTGYYVMVHGNSSKLESYEDTNMNKFNCGSETVTPEGMDKLEWDLELGESQIEEDNEDVWSNQYKWYAKILARTSPHIEYNSMNRTKCNVNMQNDANRCSIHYAAEAGHLLAVLMLIEAGATVDASDVNNLTPLHLASNRGHLSVVEALLNNGANSNSKSIDKLTPLHYACSRGFANVVDLLISKGANINSLDSNERSPLSLAVARGCYNVAISLLNAGVKVNNEDIKGNTPLCEAVYRKDVALTKLLLLYGAKITPTSYLLHYAVLHRQVEMVSVLLRSGAFPNSRDDCGVTPLILAVTTCQHSIVKILLSHDAQVDLTGSLSWKTPLVMGIETKTESLEMNQIFCTLLENGASFPLHIFYQTLITALRYDNAPAFVILMAYGGRPPECHKTKSKLQEVVYNCRRIPSQRLYGIKCAAYCCIFVNVPQFIFDIDDIKAAEIKLATNGSPDDFLMYQKFNPFKLKEICRYNIRNLKPTNNLMTNYASSLDLPVSLVNYLMLSDVVQIPGLNCPFL